MTWMASRLALAAAGGLLAMGSAMAYESSYPPTPPGTIEIKHLPPARALEASGGSDYFDDSGRPFMVLFRYIRSRDLAMTVPVEADPAPARMRFFVERSRGEEDLPSENGVRVLDLPGRTVASIGIRGGYSRDNFEKALASVRDWLASRADWTEAGEPYAVYWNGPYVPAFLKRAEVHVPVARR